MKIIFAVIFSLSINAATYGQDLAGEWRGYFTNEYFANSIPALQSNISLSISINSDGTYKIFSFSNFKNNYGQDSIITCRVIYKKTGKNSFKLKEESDDSTMDQRMLQLMSLRLVHKKNCLLLKGEWKSSDAQDISHGFMHFEKVVVKKNNGVTLNVIKYKDSLLKNDKDYIITLRLTNNGSKPILVWNSHETETYFKAIYLDRPKDTFNTKNDYKNMDIFIVMALYKEKILPGESKEISISYFSYLNYPGRIKIKCFYRLSELNEGMKDVETDWLYQYISFGYKDF